jgi:hypothetical protein
MNKEKSHQELIMIPQKKHWNAKWKHVQNN